MMVRARLHVICGNCGSTELEYQGGESPNLRCHNCSTLHFVTDINERGGYEMPKPSIPIEKLEALREALEFYANQSNWAMHPEFENACCLDIPDYGERARQALTPSPQE